ncbi:MAG: tetratricopeptide repeat protein [Candidatus Cloacimonetes bacterium]|nr:tetratricopeptide repeat protein [Candidatus Cloacimonadota bacterium]
MGVITEEFLKKKTHEERLSFLNTELGLKNEDNKLQIIREYEELIKMVQECEENEKIELSGYICKYTAFAYEKEAEIEKAVNLMLTSVELFQKTDRKIVLAETIFSLAELFISIENYDRALSHLYDSLLLIEEKKNPELSANIYKKIGDIHLSLGDYYKSSDYYNRCIRIAQNIKNKCLVAEATNELGLVYFKMDELEKSKKLFLKSIRLFSDSGKVSKMIAPLVNLSKLYNRLSDIKKAKDNLLKAASLINKEDMLNKCIVNLELGKLYNSEREFPEAKKYLMIADSMAGSLNSSALKAEVNFEIYLHLKNTNQYKKALFHLEQYNNFKDKIFNQQILDNHQRLNILFDINSVKRESELFRSRSIELTQMNKEIVEQKKTLEKQHQEILELEKKNSVLAMAVTANHELNQPLMILQGNIEMLESIIERENNKTQYVKLINNIKSSLQRIIAILNKFKGNNNISFSQYSDKTRMVIFNENNNKEDL